MMFRIMRGKLAGVVLRPAWCFGTNGKDLPTIRIDSDLAGFSFNGPRCMRLLLPGPVVD